ncbi:hypothetical protein HK098_007669 [Nowakowskiella sp. JEL0407]|nr:hypothetical protein HK098_007669 [Nowakowskiella sp. JEL0407]
MLRSQLSRNLLRYKSFPNPTRHALIPIRNCSNHVHPQTRRTSTLTDFDVIPTEKRTVTLEMMLENNQLWSTKMTQHRPNFFKELATSQDPEVLWIGCADSRVPSNSIVGLLPGEVFTHRNIANLVVHTDLSLLSVLQYAVDVLKVKHIVVCGHYGCGGVITAMGHRQVGIIDNWLRHIKDIYDANVEKIEALPEGKPREDFLCELNVFNSVQNVVNTSIVQNAWARGQEIDVHGWCYQLEDGKLRDLGLCISDMSEVHDIYKVFRSRKGATTGH